MLFGQFRMACCWKDFSSFTNNKNKESDWQSSSNHQIAYDMALICSINVILSVWFIEQAVVIGLSHVPCDLFFSMMEDVEGDVRNPWLLSSQLYTLGTHRPTWASLILSCWLWLSVAMASLAARMVSVKLRVLRFFRCTEAASMTRGGDGKSCDSASNCSS